MIDAPHFIGGQWVAGIGAPFSSIDPSTGQTIWSGNAADAATVDAAVVAAQKAAPGWAALEVSERERHLSDFARASCQTNGAARAGDFARRWKTALGGRAGGADHGHEAGPYDPRVS